MERVGKLYRSFAEAAAADRQYYQSLSPQQRMMVARELLRQIHGDLTKLPDVREYERQRACP